MKRFLIFFGVCLLFSVSALAQIKTVTGTVIGGDDKHGIPGATVLVKETAQGIAADIDGKYSIQVAKGQTLVFSAIGYEEQPIIVGDGNQIDVTLSVSATVLSESVVVGYGVQRKENLTGAVASVNVEKTLASRPIADVGRGLQGAVPGLSVVVASGEIGSDPIMRIRGQVASIEGNAKPLILMNNVEIPSIQLVNPDDIESISVLKDAASASIYGAKAAFGVILITTKKGAKKESVTVSYSSNFSWQNRAKDLEMAGIDGMQYTLDAARTRDPEDRRESTIPGQFWKISEESIAKAKEWQKKYGGIVKSSDPLVYGRDWYYDPVRAYKYSYRTFDAFDLLVKEWAPTMTQNLSINGLSGKTSYSLGLGMLDQTGMTKPAKIDDFKRYNTSINISTEVNKYLTIHGGVIYSDRNKRYPTAATAAGDPWLYAFRWGAAFPIVSKDQLGNDLRSPVFEFANTTTSSLRNVYTNINLSATVNITKDWDVQFDYTHVTQDDIEEKSMRPLTAYDTWVNNVLIEPWLDDNGDLVYVDNEGNVAENGGIPAYRFGLYSNYSLNGAPYQMGYISRKSTNTNSNIFNVYSTFNQKIGDDHEIKVMAGMNSVAKDWQFHYAVRDTLTNFDNIQFNYATGKQEVDGGSYWESQLGFFGRINYSFKGKYLLELNLRHDGSSMFPKEPRNLKWKLFPSASVGWTVSNENFMEKIKDILSFAKIRVSYGSIGDQSVSSSLYVPIMGVYDEYWLGAGGSTVLSYRTPDAVSGDITWQNIVTLDFGVDLRFWKNRIGLTFDWYRRDTKDMIIPGEALPYTFGTSAPKGNYGNLSTNGFEIALDFNYKFSNGLIINGMATMSDATTRITKGADYLTPWGDRLTSNTWATGARYGDIWGYVTDRLYQEDDFVYDANGKMKKITIRLKGNAKESYMLVGDNPVYQTFLEDGGGAVIFRPGDVKFVDLNGDGYITSGSGTFGDPGDRKVIGNSTPRYQYGFRLGADWKGFDFSIFFQGVGARKIWGSGQLAIPGYNATDGAIPQAIAGNYWTPERTDAFYPKPWDNGTGNTNYSLQVQSRYLLNMAYLRIKNITLGYSLPESLLKKVLLTKARFYVSLENFFTFDNLRGLPIDPETITGYSMFNTTSYNLSRTGTGTPIFKSASIGIQLNF